MCCKCLSDHEHKCIYPKYLPQYANDMLLQNYKDQLKRFQEKRELIEESMGYFTKMPDDTKDSLCKIKLKLETLLKVVNDAIDLIDLGKIIANNSVDFLKDKIENDAKEVNDAINGEDMGFIMEKIEEIKKPDYISLILGEVKNEATDSVEDSEETKTMASSQAPGDIVKSLDFPMKDVLSENSLEKLENTLNGFIAKYQIVADRFCSTVNNKYIYGVCAAKGSFTILCKYEISKERIITSVTVPSQCTVSQIDKQIFLSGGSNGYEGLDYLNEYVESSQSLVSKAPMNAKKYFHAVEALSTKQFVTIGGYNKQGLNHCEEYSIEENKWVRFPNLNVSRYYPATALLESKFLYAIGGGASNSSLERIDISAKEKWELLNLTVNEMSLAGAPAATRISKREIMIFMNNDVGIYNSEANTVRKSGLNTISDNYYSNSVCVISGRAYILGNSGNMHIYNLHTKNFEDMKFEQIAK